MSAPVAMPERRRLPLRTRAGALLAVALGRFVAELPPRRIRRVLELLRGSAAPATPVQARDARRAVTAVSTVCAGEGCLPRSLATAVLCRMRGCWPTWCSGVRTAPFSAHAWVQVDDDPVDESFPPGYYQVTLTVPPASR